MRRGFKYWWKDHKRAFWVAVLLGFLYDIANMPLAGGLKSIFPASFPMWLSVVVSCLLAALVGLLLMALTTWGLTIVLLLAQMLANIGLSMLGHKDNIKAADLQEGAARSAAGLAVAYWIGYKFYMLWIK